MKKTTKPPLHDWTRFDGMTEAQRHAAALKDPDAQPLQPEDMTRMKCTPQVSVIRRALSLSQEEFATRFHSPWGLCAIGNRAARNLMPPPVPILW
ncbi:MAG: hypothetical protein ACRESZ_00380 [Methylococcales bacterium]